MNAQKDPFRKSILVIKSEEIRHNKRLPKIYLLICGIFSEKFPDKNKRNREQANESGAFQDKLGRALPEPLVGGEQTTRCGNTLHKLAPRLVPWIQGKDITRG